MDLVRRLLRFALKVLRYSTRALAALERRLALDRVSEGEHHRNVALSMTRYDMVANPDESHYRDQYLHWIEQALRKVGLPEAPVCIDLGCGQGRLTLALAARFPRSHVLGIDLSEPALAAARRYAAERGVTNASYRLQTIAAALAELASDSVDLALMLDVAVYHPGWDADLREIRRVLKPGGLVCAGFRPLYYDALSLVHKRLWEQTGLLLGSRKGSLYGGGITFTWQKSTEVRRLIADELGMHLLHLVGIGSCSGSQVDPLGLIARPSRLDPDERGELMRLELALAPEHPDAGRMLLAIAQKPEVA